MFSLNVYFAQQSVNNEFSKQYISGHSMMIYCDKTKRECCHEISSEKSGGDDQGEETEEADDGGGGA